MKKRLLITSIVMMLVVAVALSTATYAWFTSSATVTSSSITMTAATNDAAALGISWTDGNYGPSITAEGPGGSDTFKPACPATLVKVGDTGTVTESTVAFTTAFATPSDGDMVFLANGTATPVYTWSDDDDHTSFFVKNLSPANTIAHVTLTAQTGGITGTGASLVRVGVFKKDGDVYKLLGVIANKETYAYTAVENNVTLQNDPGNTGSATVTYYKKSLGKYVAAVAGTAQEVLDGIADYENGVTKADGTDFFTRSTPEGGVAAKATYGTITAEASVNAMAAVDCVTSIEIASNLAAGGVVELVVKVWEDAVALGDAEHGQTSVVGLTISAS